MNNSYEPQTICSYFHHNARGDEEIHMVYKRDCERMERGVEFGRESEFGKIDGDKERDEFEACKRWFPTWMGVLIRERFVGFV